MYEKVPQFERFPKTEIKHKIKKGEKIIFSPQNINLFLIGDYRVFKNKPSFFCLYIVIFLIVISFFLYIFFPEISRITNGIPEFNQKYEKQEELKAKDNKNRFIIVRNAEGEPDTMAEVIIQNQIDFNPKISVIIPVYNTENYLPTCLETVTKQTLKKIEIICIDDGSTDNSLDILMSFAKKDKRLTILKQENLYSGVARNAGLSIANGKYLSFLDSDDFLELNMLEEMYKKITKKKSDIIICQSKSIDLDTGLLNEHKFNNNLRLDLIPKKNSFSALEISDNIFQICEGWAWDKLFRTDFIISNNIRFLNTKIFNDNQFTYTALCSAKSITTIKKKTLYQKTST